MYEQYLRDPASVGEEWRQLFDNGKVAELPIIPTNREEVLSGGGMRDAGSVPAPTPPASRDRKSTRLNSSHTVISYAVFCLKKKKNTHNAKPWKAQNSRRNQ